MSQAPITLLVNPPTPNSVKNREFILPPALLYLAGYLEAEGEAAAILDLNVSRPWESDPDNPEELCYQIILDKIAEIRPSLIGFGCLFTGQFLAVLRFAEKVKKYTTEIPIVIGGMHATLFAREILEHVPSIDYVVLGEGESQLLALTRYLKHPKGDPPISDGFAFRKNGSVIVKAKQQFLNDLDALPFPAYGLVDFSQYHHDTSHWHNPKRLPIGVSVPLISSRSCPCKCNFCSMYLVGGTKFRSRSAENVVAEMELLYHTYDIRHFSFMDDNLTLNKQRTLQMCSLIIKKNLNIQFETLNGLYVPSLDAEVIDALAAAGWVRGALAIESGSDYIRNKVMRKNLSREKIYDVAAHIRKHPQVHTKAYFIIGMPEETQETLAETYRMIETIDIDEPTINNIVPFPGTELFKQCLDDNLLLENVKTENLWKDDSFFLTNSDRFYLTPYQITIQELQEQRLALDQLAAKKIAAAKMRRTINA